VHSQNKTKQLVTEIPHVTVPFYAMAQLSRWRSPIIISEVTRRSLRIRTAVRGTESSLNESKTDFSILQIWSFLPRTRGRPASQGLREPHVNHWPNWSLLLMLMVTWHDSTKRVGIRVGSLHCIGNSDCVLRVVALIPV